MGSEVRAVTKPRKWDLARCEALDQDDPLAHVRERFALPEGIVYLDGNSLGALPRSVPPRLAEVATEQWGKGLVGSWEEWMSLPEQVGDKIARLIGARDGEVVVIDSTTIALVKVLAGALRARPDRHVIVTSLTNFPSDLYAAAGVARLLGDVEVRAVDPAGIEKALDPAVAVLLLTHVDFRTGELFDIARLTAAAHSVGALAIWDLCHSAGAVIVDCERTGLDLAVGCSYKYLNGGPGAPAFAYARSDLHATVQNPLPGWLGHASPFDFEASYHAAAGIRGFVTSTPAILGLSALDAALDAFEGLTMEAIRQKSVSLTELFIASLEERELPGLQLASPRDEARRGSQVSLGHGDAYAVVQALISRGVIGDFRAPDLCRFGFSPLYLRHVDVFEAVEQLEAVLETKEYTDDRFARRRAVT
jgi:kynureninase